MRVERFILAVFLLWLAGVFAVVLAHGAEKPLPQPEQPAERYGCTVDATKAEPGVMPAWFVHVWAEGKALAQRWIRLLSIRPLEPSARRKALDDCDRWMKQMDKSRRDAH